MIGKHVVILREYDATLKPSDVCFSRLELWVNILNLPFGWMEARRGARAVGLIGEVVKVDTDDEGRASGPFLRARVSVEVNKPLRRGVMLKNDKNSSPEWFDIQYEKLPFYCYSCGLIGHMDLECPTPAPRNALGKLPYDCKLRAPEEKKKKPLSFGAAASAFFGGARGGDRRPSSSRRSTKRHGKTECHPTDTNRRNNHADGEEVISPTKVQMEEAKDMGENARVRNLQEHERLVMVSPRKRKATSKGSQPDLNKPVTEEHAVPVGLVFDIIAQLGNTSNRAGERKEVPKKQRVSATTNARSAAAAGSSPRRAP
jgi:hypothetical protein